MATTQKTKTARKSARADRRASKTPSTGQDAIALLEADHREVEGWFEDYELLETSADKQALAAKICLALKVHTQIEEELFYPPARKATGDTDLLDEAIVEHAGAKNLIAEIEAMRPGQPLYDAKIKVLGEQVRHHIEEEETELFPEVRKTELDLKAIGGQLSARKAKLMTLLAPSVTA
jgi:hemerythrin superfamily protein